MTVDNALVVGISEAQIREVKRMQISQPASKSIKQNGRKPELFSQLIKLAVSTLEMLIRRIFDMVSSSEKEISKAGADAVEKVAKVVAEPAVKEGKTEVATLEQEKGNKVEKQAPERPKQSVLASKYLRLREAMRSF